MAIDGQNAYLLAMMLAAVCFGIFTVLYCIVVYIMFRVRKPSQSRKSAAMIIVTFMMLISTIHIAVTFVRTRIALLDYKDDTAAAIAFIISSSTPTYLFQGGLYGTQTLMADAFLVYRLYIVYARDKLALTLASILYLGSSVATIGTLVFEGLSGSNTTVFQLSSWITAFVACTFATNFICTMAIAIRLVIMDLRVAHMKKDRHLTRVAVIIIESGAIYSLFLIALLIFYVMNNFSLYVPFFLLPQVIGVTFSLVMIRVSMGVSMGDTNVATTSGPLRFSRSAIRGSRSHASSFGLVHITRVRRVDYDDSIMETATTQKSGHTEFDDPVKSHSESIAIEDVPVCLTKNDPV